jgi:hypothetical protein
MMSIILNDPRALNIRKKNDERFIVSLKKRSVTLKRKIEKRFYDGIIPLPFFATLILLVIGFLIKTFTMPPF